MRKLFKQRKTFIVIGIILILLVGFRLYLPTLARQYVTRQLNQDPLYHGEVKEVHLSLWRGAYGVDSLSIERVEGQKKFPLISAKNIDIGIHWKDLIHGAVLAKVKITDLVVNITQERLEDQKQVAVGQKTKEGKKQEAQSWKDVVRSLIPIDISRLSVLGKSIHFRDLTSSPPVNVHLDNLKIEGTNLTNSSKFSKDLFGTIEIHALMMGSGQLDMKLYVNPLVSPPQFKAVTQLSDLDLTKLNEFFTAYGSFDVKAGTLGIYSEMATANNRVEGYIKPIIKGLKVADLKKDSKKGVFHAAWEVLVGAVGGIFKNRHEDQQAARITFSGRLDDPQTSTWDTVKTVIYNAFVKPISPKLDRSVKLSDVKNQSH